MYRGLGLAVHLYTAFEEAVDEFEYIGCIQMLAQAHHQAVMVDAVKECLQVNVHHPAVSFLDRGLGVAHRLLSVAPGPKAVAVGVEVAVPLALDDLSNGLLDESIRHGRDAQ